MKSSLWTFHMETSQLTMTSQLSTSGITKDETMAVELSPHQFQICQVGNGQFCTISTPFQPLANPLTCISALYALEIQQASHLDAPYK